MSRRAYKVCRIKDCPELTPFSLCPIHQKEEDSKRDKRRTRDRSRFNSSWKVKRTRYLRTHPWCVDCGQAANTVDHVVPLSKGGQDNENNYQSMCTSCHSRKTASKDGGFGNPIK